MIAYGLDRPMQHLRAPGAIHLLYLRAAGLRTALRPQNQDVHDLQPKSIKG
jgi:hypothetical protein